MVSWFFGTWNQFSSRTKVCIHCGEVFKAANRHPFKLQFTKMIYVLTVMQSFINKIKPNKAPNSEKEKERGKYCVGQCAG